MASPLPASDSFVDLHLLDGGSWYPPEALFHAGAEEKPYRMYDWAFYIHHPKLNRHVMWDVGMSVDASLYTPFNRKAYYEHFNPQSPRRSLQKQLSGIGASATDVDTVLFSHAHWDHCRPVRGIFPNAHGYFGPGTKAHCSPGHFQEPSSMWDGAFFDPEKATERWSEIEGPWVPFGPFEQAKDFFGDGSLWLVQAPGHMPGNLFAAVRLQGGDWVILGGDCCHSRGLLDGKYEIAQLEVPEWGTVCAHLDLETARSTIKKLRNMELDYGINVALAHDEEWMRQGTNKVLMSLLDNDMKAFVTERLVDSGTP